MTVINSIFFQKKPSKQIEANLRIYTYKIFQRSKALQLSYTGINAYNLRTLLSECQRN